MFITSSASCLPLLLGPWRELARDPAGLGRGGGALGLHLHGQQARLPSVHGLALPCPAQDAALARLPHPEG